MDARGALAVHTTRGRTLGHRSHRGPGTTGTSTSTSTSTTVKVKTGENALGALFGALRVGARRTAQLDAAAKEEEENDDDDDDDDDDDEGDE